MLKEVSALTETAKSVKRPTFDLGLGLDLRVMTLSPVLGSIPSVEPI